MIYLILSIASSTLLFVIFRWIGLARINNFQAVAINYWVAGLLGLGLFFKDVPEFTAKPDNLITSGAMGILFITIFYFMVRTTQEYGISVGSVANKMAVVIPTVVAISLYSEPVNSWKIIGILLAIVSLYLTNKKKGKDSSKYIGLFPIIVFLGSGLIDTILNYAAFKLVREYEGIFTSFIFLAAGILGAIAILYKREKLQNKALIGGLVLGTVNFGSIYFILKTLNADILGASAIFPINNLSIVLCSTFVSASFFKEKLSLLNIFGILFAIASIAILGFLNHG
ncbi:EamA family transporter [Salibacter sp.]|uniref:EamA family transporter n=1 Tax=Salibacter sp. TaxID=2010995 RepID=UPI0028705306|nr:EamA family transporter [Salibacter sp.]MDR9488040.1 EamA family transporter [Salibacter sp.]